ncbi:MAG: TlpA family protein disulfide reductase [Planctomycetes bacterium]|nr:TlpA family protein disulfide reductase [Planctomycetota bacterium]
MAHRRTWWIAGLLALVGAVSVSACVVHWPLSPGSAAPALDVEWLQGEPIDPRQPDGRIVVVEQWATWCGPCMGVIPSLDALQRRCADRGVRVVAVAVMDDEAEVRRFVERRGPSLSYSIALDRHGQVAKQWRVQWTGWFLPCSFVVDGSGRVASCGLHDLDGVVQRLLRKEPDDPSTATIDRLAEPFWDAIGAKDLRTALSIAEEASASCPKSAFSWSLRARATPRGPDRDAVAKQALAALRGDAAEVATFAAAAWRSDCLGAIASEAHEVLSRATWQDASVAVAVARLRVAHLAEEAQFATTIDAAIAGLAARPADLVQAAQELVTPRHDDGGTAVATPGELNIAALRLVEAAAPTFSPWHALRLHYHLLVQTGADAARLDAAGRHVIDELRGFATELNGFAWDLLTDPAHLATTRSIALLAAEAMADAPHGDGPNQLDTLALARFENGDVDGAIATQERAIAKLSEPSADFTERLERYRRAKTPLAPAQR